MALSYAINATSSISGSDALLNRFWLSRGVVDADQRRQLLDVASLEPDPSPAALSPGGESHFEQEAVGQSSSLPGVASFWGSLDGASAQHVARVSRRVLALHQLLGGKDDIDIVWMIEREPDLLVADLSVMTARLVELRTADGCAGIDVVKLAEQHPSLLLSNELASDGEESAAQRQAAWAHGLLGDGDTAWARRLEQLEAYGAAHGDVHVGHRDGDDAELVRWAGKQRKDHKKGELASDRRERLHAVGFEFDDERAEWLRWYNELKAFEAVSGHCTPVPLAAGADFLLINWCAVQRIARRSGVMPEDRKAMLDVLGFDWSGADPLS